MYLASNVYIISNVQVMVVACNRTLWHCRRSLVNRSDLVVHKTHLLLTNGSRRLCF